MLRTLIGTAAVAALFGLLAVQTPTGAAQVVQKDRPQIGNLITHEGTVVSVTRDKLVMRAKGDKAKEHEHKLAPDAKVSCDGKACVLSDLKPGQRVRVTTKKDDPGVAIRVEALDKNKAFETIGGGKGGGAQAPGQPVQRDKAVQKTETHEGTIVSVGKNKIVMKGKGDKAKEHTHMLAPDAKVMCDGKTCTLSDLKPGQRVRITTPRDNLEMALRVEALDKLRTFNDLKDRSK